MKLAKNARDSHADQCQISRCAPVSLDPEGQEESNDTPHLTQAPSLAESQGGSYSNIYKDIGLTALAISKYL